MRIGLIVGLHGRTDKETSPAPSWEVVRSQVLAAEAAGFDLVVFEDALLYPVNDGAVGYWECVSMMAAVAEATNTIEFGPSVFNAPYRSPAMVAKIADTLDEISAGRFILGLGAGNTPDYEAFGFALDKRYSRFAEGIEIIHSLVRTGSVDYTGRYHSARETVLYPRGPRSEGPSIVIAAGGPKMMRLTAHFADEWNWWAVDIGSAENLKTLADELDRACEEVGRDPGTLRRSIDLYNVDPLGLEQEDSSDNLHIGGSSDEIAETLLTLCGFDVDEIRCNLDLPEDLKAIPEAVGTMSEVVDKLHTG